MADYREMWKGLGLNLEKHDVLLNALTEMYGNMYMSQKNRPKGMEYFDFVVSEAHGLRIKELLDHKAAGGKVVGTFCVYVPDEIITAANGIGVGLCGGAQISIPDAETVLPANLCPLIKSVFGFKLGLMCPYLEASDYLVGETTCDGKKKVWEIFDKHIPTYVMEVPQKKTKKARELYLEELKLFKDKVEKESGVKITPEKLNEKIKLMNAKRKAIQRLYELRKTSPSPISGKDALLISQIAFYDNPERFTAQLNALCDELEERAKKGIGAMDKKAKRLMISGCPMALPNWKMHHIIETSGANVVCEETCTGTRYFASPVIDENIKDMDGQMKAIADRYMSINCSCFTPNDERIDDIVRLAKEYKVDGVVYYSLQFCLTYNLEFGKVKQALDKARIPLLKIETDYSDEDAGQLKTRIEGFLERLS